METLRMMFQRQHKKNLEGGTSMAKSFDIGEEEEVVWDGRWMVNGGET